MVELESFLNVWRRNGPTVFMLTETSPPCQLSCLESLAEYFEDFELVIAKLLRWQQIYSRRPLNIFSCDCQSERSTEKILTTEHLPDCCDDFRGRLAFCDIAERAGPQSSLDISGVLMHRENQDSYLRKGQIISVTSSIPELPPSEISTTDSIWRAPPDFRICSGGVSRFAAKGKIGLPIDEMTN